MTTNANGLGAKRRGPPVATVRLKLGERDAYELKMLVEDERDGMTALLRRLIREEYRRRFPSVVQGRLIPGGPPNA